MKTRLIDLQLKAMLALTHAVLPGMLARTDGYILNVASVYAFSPVANQAVYAACKTFMKSFSRSLALELDENGRERLGLVSRNYTHQISFRAAGNE